MDRTEFIHDLIERATWTFIQAFTSVMLTMPFLARATEGTIDPDLARTAIIAAVMAGLAAVLSAVKAAAGRRLDRYSDGDASLGLDELRRSKAQRNLDRLGPVDSDR